MSLIILDNKTKLDYYFYMHTMLINQVFRKKRTRWKTILIFESKIHHLFFFLFFLEKNLVHTGWFQLVSNYTTTYYCFAEEHNWWKDVGH